MGGVWWAVDNKAVDCGVIDTPLVWTVWLFWWLRSTAHDVVGDVIDDVYDSTEEYLNQSDSPSFAFLPIHSSLHNNSSSY